MKIGEIKNKVDFCIPSTLAGVILGTMILLAGIVIHFLPGIVGFVLYSFIACTIGFKILFPILRKHDGMKHTKKFPIGYLGGFLITFMVSLYLIIEIAGLTP